MFEFIIKFVEKVWSNGGKIYFKEIVIFVDKIDDKFVFKIMNFIVKVNKIVMIVGLMVFKKIIGDVM